MVVQTSPKEHVLNHARYVSKRASEHSQRTGQFLFNILRPEIAGVVRGTFFDPFYKEMTFEQIVTWLDEHIIFNDDGVMIGLFAEERVLWEGF